MYEVNLQIWLDPELFKQLKELKTKSRTWKEFLIDPQLKSPTQNEKDNSGQTVTSQ